MSDDTDTFDITQPVEGTVPEEVMVTVDGTTYRYYDYAGKTWTSSMYPDVLSYHEREIVNIEWEGEVSDE